MEVFRNGDGIIACLNGEHGPAAETGQAFAMGNRRRFSDSPVRVRPAIQEGIALWHMKAVTETVPSSRTAE